MSETNSNEAVNSPATQANPFSNQATGLLETTFAETLGLSMHNAVSNQQSSQMTTSASVTNACARLLQTPTVARTTAEENKDKTAKKSESDSELTAQPEKKGILKNLSNIFKRDKKSAEAESGEDR